MFKVITKLFDTLLNQSDSQLNLIIPGLFWPDEGEMQYKKLELKYLPKILSRANLTSNNYVLSDFIYSNLNIADSLAVKYAKELGVNGFTAYLLASPCNVRLNRDHLLISEAELLDLNLDDVQLIVDAINQEFKELELFIITPNLWLCGLKNPLTLKTNLPPICDIIGEDIAKYLNRESSDINLVKLINQLQMFLHNFSLISKTKASKALKTGLESTKYPSEGKNISFREASVLLDPNIKSSESQHFKMERNTCSSKEYNIKPDLNCLWLWNKEKSLDLEKIIYNDLDLSNFDTNTYYLIDKLYYPACYRDWDAWYSLLQEFDNVYFKEILKQLQGFKIKRLSLQIPNQAKNSIYQLSSLKSWLR